MSEISDDDMLPSRAGPTSDEAAAAARKIAALSDDESEEDEANERRSPPPSSPMPREGGEAEEPMNGSSKTEPLAEGESSPDREASPDIADSYERYAGVHGAQPRSVDMMHFPPNISFSMAVTDKLERLPIEQNPILYRLKPGLRGDRSAAEAVLDHVKKTQDVVSLKDIIESNANLITWSDGSKTIAIGSQQFLLIEDAVASKHYLFRRGDKIQTFEADVKSVVRVQPSSTGDASVKLAMATAAGRAASNRPAARTMLRCMDDGGENEEEKAKMESQRRERERARMEARRRQARERQVRPDRGLTVDALESNDEDSGDDQVRRIEERVGANRLLRAKRAAPPVRPDITVKRRKAGRRKLVSDDDDAESDESDL